MYLNRLNVLLVGLLVLIAVLAATTRVDYSKPNFEFLPDMKYTPAATAYSPNPLFANGQTLQDPVEGTIARGQMPLHFEATPAEAIRAGNELVNPYQQDQFAQAAEALQASIRRGGDAYRVFCICCHGATGGGDGPVTGRGFPPPPSLLTGKSKQMRDGQLFHIVTFGQATMPDFAGQLSSERRWDVINYIRSLQPAPLIEGGDAEATADEDATNQTRAE